MRLLVCLLLLQLTLFGKEVLCINKGFTKSDTLESQLLFQDSKSLYSFDTIHTIPFETLSLRMTKETPSPFWIKVRLKNCSSEAINVIFKHPRAGLDFIDAYLFEGDKLVATHLLGDLREASLRQIPYRQSLFLHVLQPQQEYTLITKLHSYGAYELYWLLEDAGYFAKNGSIETIIFGMFIGTLIALGIYNLILYLNIKEKAFLMYVLHIASICIHQASNNGILYHYLSEWIDVKLLTIGIWVFPHLSLAFLLLFAYEFFGLKGMRWGKVLGFSATLSLAIAFFYSASFWYMPILYTARYLTPFSLAILLLIILLSLHMLYQKKFAAVYFALGQGIYVFAILYYMLGITGFIAKQSYDWLIPIFGIVCDLIFLSLALGKRMSHVQQEAQEQARLIAEQSRFALIGQTVGNVTHQWKAPVSKLTSQLMFLQATFTHQKDAFMQEFEKMIPEINSTIEFIQKNIDLFYHFYQYSDEKRWFNPIEEIKTIEIILEDRLTLGNIHCDITADIQTLQVHKSAFKNIIMICFENAINALLQQEEDRFIKISLEISDQEIVLLFKDNAPLLKKQESKTIPNSDGCGIGLSLATMLAQKQLDARFIRMSAPDSWTTFELRFKAAYTQTS